MGLFFSLLFLCFIISITEVVRAAIKSEQIDKKPVNCPPHNWQYRSDNKMQCLKCDFIAGTFRTSNGEYNE